jgi:NCS1 family nucleobase:cation symporter-1
MTDQTTAQTEVDGILPTPATGRVFGGVSYVLMWWSSLIVIQAFALGQGFLPPIGQMNLYQSLVVMVVAAVLFVVMFSLNGQAGLKYGIPYSVQTRTGFGVRGSKFVEFLRIVPAIIWYGIGTWIAALSMDGILQALSGPSHPLAKYGYFIGLQVLQTALAWRGVRTMKWFNAIGAIVMAAVMIGMLVHIVDTYGFRIQSSWQTAGTWGTPFWVGLTAAIGVLATVMLNISDMTRHLQKSQSTLWLGHLFGIAPPWFFMLFLGIVAGASLGIWDPVQALMKLSPNPAVMVVLLTFILVAQITTNLTINILPPALIFMDTFKIRWDQGVMLTGVLGVVSFPWLIMADSAAFLGFILHYSALFGPILGVMLADYFVVRRRVLDVESLYVTTPASPYWYHGGVNLAGILAVLIPGTVTMIWFLPMSWLIGVPVAFILYLTLLPRLYPAVAAGGRAP